MSEQQWYYRKGKARFGPVGSAELKKLATSGELTPEDLLRGVGMSEWVPAEKVKGLFAPPKPAPSKSAPPKVTPPKPAPPKVEPAPVPPTVPKSNPSAPIPAPAPQAADDPFAAFGLDSAAPADPFATFGLDSSSSTDPFATAESAQNDPFAAAMPGMGLAGGGISFDNLAALEKQGQTIYREPPPEAEPDPSTVKAKPVDEPAGMSNGARLGLFLMPFAFMTVMGLFLSTIFALMHWFVMGFFAVISAIIFSFMMTSGMTKAMGLFAGNCLIKLKIKNEVLALGYGGLLGIFGLYMFIGGYAWAALYFNPFQGVFDKLKVEIQAEEEAAALAAAERQAAGEEEEGEEAEMAEDENAEAENAKEEEIVLDLFGGDGDALDALDEFNRKRKEKDRRDNLKEAGFYGVFSEPIPLYEAYSPLWVYRFLVLLWWFWPIHGLILLLGTAHATWMSNLGYDPTK